MQKMTNVGKTRSQSRFLLVAVFAFAAIGLNAEIVYRNDFTTRASAKPVPAVAALSAVGDIEVRNIKPGKAGLWNQPSSYEEGTLPESGFAIQVAAGVQATANDADCEFMNTTGIAVLWIRGSSDTEKSSLTVTITNEEAVLNSMVVSGNTRMGLEFAHTHGFVKKGSGRLRLAPIDTNGYANYDLNCNYVVDNGVLQFPVEPTTKVRHYKRLTINNPGVAWMSTAENDAGQNMYFNEGLCGDGVFSNTVSAVHTVRLNSSGTFGDIPVFTGHIAGNVKLTSQKGATILAGTCDSTENVSLDLNSAMYMSVIGGGTGENVVNGSAGSGNFIVGGRPDLEQTYATLGYIGSGQTAYATVTDGKNLRSFTIDGGPNGSLDFTGDIALSESTNSTASLVLGGTNANECVLSGKVTGSTTAGRAVRIVKRGSGTWRIPGNDASTVKGVVVVEEGTLKADTLAPAGKNCSLGYSTLLQEDYGGVHDPSRLVPYSILLGSDSARGTLQYSGAGDMLVSTRPIALAGEGALKSDDAALSWYGVTAADAGAKTLVLDGSASGSKVFNVTNGPGTVSVVKEGSGTWTLGGTLGFTGGIDVKEGTLSISSATNSYTWYRVMFREAFTAPDQIDVTRIGLFNAEGRMQCANLVTNNDAFADTTLLQPGETVLHTFYPGAKLSDLINTRFSAFATCFEPSHAASFVRFSGKVYPTLENDNTQVGCVLRLPAGADPVTSYDFGTRWPTSAAATSLAHALQSWTIEGSVDGIDWTELSTVISNRTWTGSAYSWLRSGLPYFYNAATKEDDPNALNTDGWPIASGIAPGATLDAGIDNLSVATNATVTADKTVTTRKITVDAAGMGSATGFALAEDGVIDIVNAPESGNFEVDVDFTGILLPSSYSVLVNGKATKRIASISPDGRKLTVAERGFSLTIL